MLQLYDGLSFVQVFIILATLLGIRVHYFNQQASVAHSNDKINLITGVNISYNHTLCHPPSFVDLVKPLTYDDAMLRPLTVHLSIENG